MDNEINQEPTHVDISGHIAHEVGTSPSGTNLLAVNWPGPKFEKDRQVFIRSHPVIIMNGTKYKNQGADWYLSAGPVKTGDRIILSLSFEPM